MDYYSKLTGFQFSKRMNVTGLGKIGFKLKTKVKKTKKTLNKRKVARLYEEFEEEMR